MRRSLFILALTDGSFFLIGGAGAAVVAILLAAAPQALFEALEGEPCAS